MSCSRYSFFPAIQRDFQSVVTPSRNPYGLTFWPIPIPLRLRRLHLRRLRSRCRRVPLPRLPPSSPRRRLLREPFPLRLLLQPCPTASPANGEPVRRGGAAALRNHGHSTRRAGGVLRGPRLRNAPTR